MTNKLKLSDIKAGDYLIADEGFTCLHKGDVRIVISDSVGVQHCADLYVECSRGKHHLDGQLDYEDQQTIVGFVRQ